MDATAILIVVIVFIAAIAFVLLANRITRLRYEQRFRAWQENELQRWEAELAQGRKAAVTQSRAVLGGKFTEQMVPYFPDFRYDPTEVRFIGTPIDLVVFPGLAVGEPREIVIMEIKSGRKPQLSPVQRKIRSLIENGMVRWEEVYRRLDDPGPEGD